MEKREKKPRLLILLSDWLKSYEVQCSWIDKKLLIHGKCFFRVEVLDDYNYNSYVVVQPLSGKFEFKLHANNLPQLVGKMCRICPEFVPMEYLAPAGTARAAGCIGLSSAPILQQK